MIFGLAVGLVLAGQQSKADEVLGGLVGALKSHGAFAVTVDGEMVWDGKPAKDSARVVVKAGPANYWCREELQEGVGYARLEGTKLIYTDDDTGKRIDSTVPTPNIIVNYASGTGYYIWDTFCNLTRYTDAEHGGAFYVQPEEIEGRPCDLIGIIKSTLEGDERMSNIRYLWVDCETHLPRAFQMHSFIRGRSTLGPKWTMTSVEPDPTVTLAEIPAQVARKVVPLQGTTTMSAMEAKPGDACLSLPVQTPEGQVVNLPSLIYGPTLVTFWASWCGPCRGEMDALIKLPQVVNGRVRVIAIGVDDSKQNLRRVVAKGSPLLHYYFDPDAERTSSALLGSYASTGIPHAYLFDSKGKLIRQWLGFETAKELSRLVGL